MTVWDHAHSFQVQQIRLIYQVTGIGFASLQRLSKIVMRAGMMSQEKGDYGKK
jgi:hypothetical protein